MVDSNRLEQNTYLHNFIWNTFRNNTYSLLSGQDSQGLHGMYIIHVYQFSRNRIMTRLLGLLYTNRITADIFPMGFIVSVTTECRKRDYRKQLQLTLIHSDSWVTL